jgi:hypothetical protein
MEEINVEMLREKLYPAAKALFIIGETLVDVSKQHISAEDAINKIRSYMHQTDVIGSRYRVDRLIEECMEPVETNAFGEIDNEWLKRLLSEHPIQTLEINFPSCCEGCSNNPQNGGSGICNCTLPYMQSPINYNDDDCMACNANGYIYTANATMLKTPVSNNRIKEAVERTKRYIKE